MDPEQLTEWEGRVTDGLNKWKESIAKVSFVCLTLCGKGLKYYALSKYTIHQTDFYFASCIGILLLACVLMFDVV